MKSEGNSIVNDDFIYDAVDADYFINAPLTDTGNAECFFFECGENYKYNKTNGKWYVWNGVVWKHDEKEEINNTNNNKSSFK